MASSPRHLGRLRPGDRAVVSKVGCERGLARRLMELGLLPGTPVAVTRVAPLGDPLELRVRDFSLSIRRAEAAAVEVTDVRSPVPVRRRVPSVRAALRAQPVEAGTGPRPSASEPPERLRETGT